jgi:hypothetical protein
MFKTPLRNKGQRSPRGFGQISAEHVETPHALLEAGDEPGFPEPGEVVADRWLAEVESGGEVADADRLGGRFEHVQHLYTRGIGERFEHQRQVVSFDRGEWWRDGDAAAFDAWWCQQVELGAGHATSIAQPLTSVDE